MFIYVLEKYAKMTTMSKGDKRKKRRENIFPKDCKKAYMLGKRLIYGI
jgi:hypothetical protein